MSRETPIFLERCQLILAPLSFQAYFADFLRLTTRVAMSLFIAPCTRLTPSFGRGFDSHRPLQKPAKFTLIRRALLTGLPLIFAQDAGFCAQVAPKFHVLVRMNFLKFRNQEASAIAARTCRTRIIQQRYDHDGVANEGSTRHDHALNFDFSAHARILKYLSLSR
jgi:hypothetical protein